MGKRALLRALAVGALGVAVFGVAVGCGFSFGSGDLGSANADGKPRPDARTTPGTEGGTEGEDGKDVLSTELDEDAGPGGGLPEGGGGVPEGGGGPLKAFVSSSIVTGNLGGVAGADALCNNLAKGAGLPGTYTAWISTTTSNAVDRITANGPWQLVNGVQIAATKADLVKGTLAARFDKDEKGNALPAVEDRVWTGTGPDGKYSSGDCGGWAVTGAQGLVGEAEQTNNGWTGLVNEACTEVNRVYCLQQ